ncbi:MAG: ATP-dependent Clp protease ATP-binding subunit [Saprospiraceae bacterium]|nr:ATP-dependent Clp protease ATP-binding subunit [Saprospiraceae bacterium]
MKKIVYPLVYFELAPAHFYGLLVGTSLKTVAGDLESLKLKFLQQLKKEYKRNGEYPEQDIIQPKLKILNVSYRPAYRDTERIHPLTYNVAVPIPVVYGKTDFGYYECWLPIFDDNFTYYSPRHMEPLAKHLINTYLNQYTPEDIFQLLNQPKPGFDLVTLKVKPEQYYGWEDTEYKKTYPTLNKLAEPYPYPKALKKQLGIGPSAAWEREAQVEDIIDKLMVSRTNVIVVGDPGTGKSAVLEQAMRKIRQRNRSAGINFWRIIPQRITGSARYLGEWEETVETLIEELYSSQGVLWAISITKLIEIGGNGPEDSVAAFMRPFIQQGKLRIIGEASPSELESLRRLLPGFAESFQIVELPQLSTEQVSGIMKKFADYAQKNLRIRIDSNGLDLAIQMLNRYFPYEQFPGKGIKFLGHCIDRAQIENQHTIGIDQVIDSFVEQTGMPELFLRDQLPLDTQELQQFFENRIIGQPRAIEQMIRLVKVFKAGLNNPNRPIATLLFAGPTGVGKTASAKALADYFFGKGQTKTPLVRMDMSEFQHPFQIARLIGNGHETGQLVTEIRERPFSVLLLDEIEKANPAIYDALLTVMDEGVLMDAFGRVTNFKNTIIIMTSNLGAASQSPIGFQQTTSEADNYASAVAQYFRPEFVNRIDGTVIFHSLKQNDIAIITRKELQELSQREGFTKKGIQITITERLISFLTRVGFDPKYGARPLQRAIEQTVVNPLANWLLANPETQNCILQVDYDQKLMIQKV